MRCNCCYVPNLRFACFSSTWHRCLLNDCVIFLDEQRKPIKEIDRKKIKGQYPYYGASGIIDNINSYIFDDNLILLSEDGANILDRNYRVSFIVRGKLWVNNHAHVLKPKNKIDINYLSEYLENLDYAKYNTGSAQPKLNQDVCKNIIINIPDYDEQQKIGEFLSIINQRIDTQSKIIEDLELFKKSIENQYFYCDKSNDYASLGDIITQLNNRNEQNKDFEVLSVSNKYGFIPQSEQFDDHEVASANKSNYKIVKQNDFAYNPARINVGSIAMLRSNQVGIVSPMYICFRANNNRILSSYLDYFSHSNKFNNEVLKNLEGSVRLCLSFESLSKIKIHLPSLDTQYEIVKNLDLISNKISIENKILEKLKEQKKYLLSNMFI